MFNNLPHKEGGIPAVNLMVLNRKKSSILSMKNNFTIDVHFHFFFNIIIFDLRIGRIE